MGFNSGFKGLLLRYMYIAYLVHIYKYPIFYLMFEYIKMAHSLILGSVEYFLKSDG